MDRLAGHKVYIAGPFFNAAQVSIISRIEDLLRERNIPFYSPRIHSGSAHMTAADRKVRSNWTPVIEDNITELHQCDCLLAVIEYAIPGGAKLVPANPIYGADDRITGWRVAGGSVRGLEFPDNGTVWECGYYFAMRALVNDRTRRLVAFHSTRGPEALNLMLSHTVDGILVGWYALDQYFRYNPYHDHVVGPYNNAALTDFHNEVI